MEGEHGGDFIFGGGGMEETVGVKLCPGCQDSCTKPVGLRTGARRGDWEVWLEKSVGT